MGCRRFTVSMFAVAALCGGCSVSREPRVDAVTIVGRTELIRVDAASLDFVARLDEEGRTTSIHALDIRVADAAPDRLDNVGRLIRFRLVNARGEERWLTKRVAGVTDGRGDSGAEVRYRVPLRLRLVEIDREVLVALHDRSALPYCLVVGRDWIGDDLVVDARRKFDD